MPRISGSWRKFATRSLESRLGRTPDETEIAAELEVSLDVLRGHTASTNGRVVVHLDAPQDGRMPAIEIADASARAADDLIAEKEAKQSLNRALEVLPFRLRHVLELSYVDQLTLRHIGSILGVTESRVCQLRSRAVECLRAGYDAEQRDSGSYLPRQISTHLPRNSA